MVKLLESMVVMFELISISMYVCASELIIGIFMNWQFYAVFEY